MGVEGEAHSVSFGPGAGQQRPWEGLRQEAPEESELGVSKSPAAHWGQPGCCPGPLGQGSCAALQKALSACWLRAPLWAGGPQGRPVWGAGQCPVLPRVPKKQLASVCSQEVPHLAVLGAVLIMKAQTWSHFHREIYREC